MATLYEALYKSEHNEYIVSIDEISKNHMHRKDYKDKLFCYDCGDKIYPRLYPLGDKANHFAHYPRLDGRKCLVLDKKEGNEGYWHSLIKSMVKREYREIIIRKDNKAVRADIHYDNRTLEIQHSNISYNDIELRENMSYVDWLFDGTNTYKIYYNDDNYYIDIIEGRNFHDIFIYTKNDVYIHIGNSMVFKLTSKILWCYTHEGKVIPLIKGKIITLEDFINGTCLKDITGSIPDELRKEFNAVFIKINNVVEFNYNNVKKDISMCNKLSKDKEIISYIGLGEHRMIRTIEEFAEKNTWFNMNFINSVSKGLARNGKCTDKQKATLYGIIKKWKMPISPYSSIDYMLGREEPDWTDFDWQIEHFGIDDIPGFRD